MRKIVSATFAAAIALSALAPMANAQTNPENGTGKSSASGTTTNSGPARPDAGTTMTPSSETGTPSKATATSGSVSGSGTQRPDDMGASTKGAPEASTPSKGTATQNR